MTPRPTKNTGIDWIGPIPCDWSVLPSRRLCELTTGSRDTQDAVEDGKYPFFVRSQEVEEIDTYSFEGEAVLTSGDGAGVGKIFHHYVGRLEFHQRVYLFYGFRGITGRFFFYYLRELFYRVALAGNAKSTVDSLRRPMLRDFPVVLPPMMTQVAITAFLDKRTAAIDALIAKKERLIELLHEKRQALITQAVTQGLDSNVPMKDSGVEWLGEIPTHWQVLRLRRLIQHLDQGWSPVAEDRVARDGEWGVLKLSAISHGEFDWRQHKTLDAIPDARYASYRVRPDDILITRANTLELVGACAVVHEEPPVPLITSDLIYRVRANRNLCPRWASLFMQSSVARLQIARDARGSSMSMAKVSQGQLLDWLIIVPPEPEQLAIVSTLERRFGLDGEMLVCVLRQIDLLREYRQALITEAITGKLDIASEPA